jgi:ATPase subunit of ABC transporter with duplicated ATPase domains
MDMEAVDALIEGLTAFPGGVLLVSHDAYLISAAADELWLCEGGSVTPFRGSFEDYKRRLRTAGGS